MLEKRAGWKYAALQKQKQKRFPPANVWQIEKKMQQALLLLLHTDSHSPLAFLFLTHTTCFFDRLWFSDIFLPLPWSFSKNRKRKQGHWRQVMPYLTMLLSWCGSCGSKRHTTKERAQASKSDTARKRARERERYRDRDCEPITLALSLLTVRSSSVAISIVDLILLT